MSDKLKGDTSRSTTTPSSSLFTASSLIANPPASAVVKNPLLSASVTGLTFDDFPNKPLLLPPVAISREPKPLVTIGSSTDVDTESLDEINLDTTTDETQTTTDSNTLSGQIDPNGNSVWSDINNPPTDSILSQAASSFSALPSVASSVLSTFSKRISEYSASNSRERTPTGDNGNIASQLDIQPAYLQQQFQTPLSSHQEQQQQQTVQQFPYYNIPQATTVLPTVGAESTTTTAPFGIPESDAAPPPEPPKFYTPTEVPAAPTVNATLPPPPGGQNTYRLAAKKKLYAPIPGFSEQSGIAGASTAPTVSTLSSATPLQGIPPLPPQPAVPTDPLGNPLQFNSYEPNYQAETHTRKQEERKTGGLFSNISNLVPSGVLQNISGLVQSATGTFSQGANKPFGEESAQPTPAYGYPGAYQQPTVEVGSVGTGQYFGVSVAPPPIGVPPIGVPPIGVPPVGAASAPQFYPTTAADNQSVAAFFAPPQHLPPPSSQQQQQQSVAQLPTPAKQEASQLFATPFAAPVGQSALPPPPPTTGFVSAPPKSVTPDINKQRPSASTTPVSYFDPTKHSTGSKPASFFVATQQPTVSPTPPLPPQPTSFTSNFAPPSAAVPSSSVSTLNTTQAVFQPIQPPPTSGIQQLNLQPGAGTQTPLPTYPTSAATHPPLQPGSILSTPTVPPPVAANQAPLPPAASGSTSFRLQKGTRLYKSPLTSAETAPVQIPVTVPQPLAPPTSFFNPFGPPAADSAPNPAASPAVPTVVPSYFIAQPAESSVGLFAVEKTEVGSEKPVSHFEPQQLGTPANVNALVSATVGKPELSTVPTTSAEGQSKEVVFEQSLSTEDFNALIAQQTIEPETEAESKVPSTSDLSAEELTDKLNSSTESTKQAEGVLNKAVQELSLQAESAPVPTEQQLVQAPQESQIEHQALIHTGEQQQDISQPEQSINTTHKEQLKSQEKEGDLIQNSALQPEHLQSESSPVAELNHPILTTNLPEVQPYVQQVLPPQPTTAPVNPLIPPSVPHVSGSPTQNQNTNPFRRNVVTAPFAHSTSQPLSETQPKLANFFAGALGLGDSAGAEFNIFTPAPPGPQVTGSTDPNTTAARPAVEPPTVPTALPSAAGFFGFANPPQPNFFQPTTEFPSLPPQSGVAPPPLALEAATTAEVAPQTPIGIPPPIGFDNFLPPTGLANEQTPTAPPAPSTDDDINTTATIPSGPLTAGNSETQHTEVVNSFSNYFNQTSNLTTENNQLQTQQIEQQQQTSIVTPPSVPLLPRTTVTSSASFFDTFAPHQQSAASADNSLTTQQQQAVTQSNEDQRLQNFFNNPPQRENNAGVGDLGYDLVHSGLAIRNLGSLTSVSNLVEPPSSSCSEFSELNNSNLIKRSPEKNISTAVITNQTAVNLAPTPQEQVKTVTEPLKELEPKLSSAITAPAATDFSLDKHYEDLPEEVLRELRMANLLTGEKAAASAPPMAVPYSPAVKHWFYKRPCGNNKYVWVPFSHYDSALLEVTLNMESEAPNIVAVEGGRYDVNISERTKTPVYWRSEPMEVRRCSWFYKGTDSKMVPYEESIADLLENEYKQAVESGEWHKKIVLSMNEQVTFHGPTVIVHFQQQQSSDAWGGTSQTTTRPRVVKRDLDEFTIEQGESQRVDHLLLMVHGIGAACDLKMRSVDEVVDDFRNIAQALVQSHYKNSTEMGLVGRVEVLPISWHSHLHSEEMGIDEKLRSITLESIPKLRNFTNNTLLDVLFYTSPKYCQKIMNTVAVSMNEVYNKYRERHPEFNGGVSVAGHSLGSLILFDLLCHQKAPKESEEQNMENPDQPSGSFMEVSNDDVSVTSYTMGPAGTGQPFIHYTQLNFQPKKFFALGSPIGMFVTIRGIDKLGLDFRLPTCSGFYNIFHPFDPVAYRIEALVNIDLSGLRPVLIPHHKGRKRMHLELKETMTRVGADLKQRFMDTFKNTLESVNFLGGSSRSRRDTEESISKDVDQVLNMQANAEKNKEQTTSDDQQQQQQANTDAPRTRSDSLSTSQSDSEMVEIDFPLGKLNDSKRIDYVLQEAPLEFINEYIFAMGAHVCYWESEDTILFVMKEIYTGLGISPDSQVPQQTMTIERPCSRNSNTLSPKNEKR